MNHPLPIGTKVISVHGETSDTDSADGVFTGPNASGTVISADHNGPSQEWTYGVEFPNGVLVFIDQHDSIDDDNKYRVG